jgi:hypothetical protein
MDNLVAIEVNSYGVCLDSYWVYVALSWQILATATALFVAYKIYKKRFVKF